MKDDLCTENFWLSTLKFSIKKVQIIIYKFINKSQHKNQNTKIL